MRASHQSQRAQTLPLPLPPPPLCLPSSPAAPRRGRHHRSSCSSSSSSSSSVSSAASSTFCPSPSPAPSPRAASTCSLVPFSWERHPGVPKTSFRAGLASSPTGGTPLPLPPPLLQPDPRRRRQRRRANANIPAAASLSSGSDPFVAAFAECTRDDDGEDDETDHGADAVSAASKDKLWLAPAKPTVSGRWRHGGGGFLGFLDLYGCKSAMAVADGVFIARRPVASSSRPGAAGRATIRR